MVEEESDGQEQSFQRPSLTICELATHPCTVGPPELAQAPKLPSPPPPTAVRNRGTYLSPTIAVMSGYPSLARKPPADSASTTQVSMARNSASAALPPLPRRAAPRAAARTGPCSPAVSSLIVRSCRLG